MPALKYQCTNLAEECEKAVTGEKIELPEGEEALCPECQRPLTLVPPETGPANRLILTGIGVLVLILIGLLFWRFSGPSKTAPKPVLKKAPIIQGLPAPDPAPGNKCGLVPAKPADVARLIQYMKQGIMFGSQKNYAQASKEFRTGLDIDGNFLGLNGNAGSAELRQAKVDDAKTYLEAEAKLDDCLASMTDDQLAPFAYYMEVPNTDASRGQAQAEKLSERVKETQGVTHYNLACLYSRQKQGDLSVAELQQALDAGFKDARSIKTDSDLAYARSTPGYKKISDQLSER